MSEEIHSNGEFYRKNTTAARSSSYLSLFREISRHWSKLGSVSALQIFNYGTQCSSTVCLLVLTSIYRILFDYKFHLIIVKLIMSVLIYLLSFGIIEIISALTTTSGSSTSGSSKSPSSLSSSIEVIDENDETWDIIIDKSNTKNITPTIEVERKFMVPDNYNERLLENGFELGQAFDEVLVDTYFDSHEHHLLKVKFWI